MKQLFVKRSLALIVAMALLFAMLPRSGLTIHAVEAAGKWTDSGNYTTTDLSGSGTEDAPYLIASAADFAKLAQDTTLATGNKHFKITADIDLSAHEWAPIASFSGVLDGDGHAITGLQLGTASAPFEARYVGMIGQLQSEATVKNLYVHASVYSNWPTASEPSVGIIAGSSKGTIDNCTTAGTVNATIAVKKNFNVGGIAGLAAGVIRNCVNRAAVTAASIFSSPYRVRVGGIVGAVNASTTLTIINCSNLGDISLGASENSANSAVGGVFGANKGTTAITNCYNAGTVTATPAKAGKGDFTGFGGTVTSCVTAEEADPITKLNEYVAQANDATLLTWTAAADGKPVPGTDLVPEVPQDVLAGTVAIAGAAKLNETLTASVSDANSENLTYQWKRIATGEGAAAEDIAGANSAQYTATLADIGYQLICVVSSTDKTGTISGQTAVVAKLDGPAAPSGLGSVKATNATTADGKITGTTAAMEYSTDPAFATATACTGSEITGLLPGRYYVRISATETIAASSAVTVVVGDATVPFEGKWTDDGNYTAGALQGTGTQADPYLITSEKDLAKLAKSFNTVDATQGKYFKVTASALDLSAHEWVSISNFAGVFDGNGVKIKGLQIGSKTAPVQEATAGMFDKVTATGLVKNMEVELAIYVEYEPAVICVGGIVGILNGSIDNVVTSGTVWARGCGADGQKCDVNVGGVVGRAQAVAGANIVISNCVNHADVTGIRDVGTDRYVKAGGVVGRLQNEAATSTSLIQLINCGNTGKVTSIGTTASQWAGGVAGDVVAIDTNYKGLINNCYNTGFVTADKGSIGSIAGRATLTDIVSCFFSEGSVAAPGTVDSSFCEQIPAAAVTNGELLQLLNVGAATLNEQLGSGKEIAYKWAVASSGYPQTNGVLANEKTVKVTINSDRMGSVTVEIQAPNSSAWVPVNASALVQPGSQVKVTVNPKTGCELVKLTAAGGVTGEYTTLTNNVFTFEVTTASVQVHVEFKVGETVDRGAVYVDPDAAVNGTGTENSPFNSLTAARDHVRGIIAQYPTANVTVYLMGGTFRLTEPLVFEAEDASLGTVTWKNYENETPVISSAVLVDKTFTKVEGKDYYKLQLDQAGGAYPHFRDLLINGKRATIAKSETLLFSKTSTEEGSMFVDPSLLEGITAANIGKLELISIVEWKSQLFHIDTIVGTADGLTEIQVEDNEWTFFYAQHRNQKSLAGREYWMQNHLAYLDEPGEFYYDEANGTVYYMPFANEDLTKATVEYATLDKMIQLMGTGNITFDGLTITGTTANWVTDQGFPASLGNCYIAYSNDPGTNAPVAAIYGETAENITIRNCVFTELGATGVLINSGAKNISIIGNSFTELAMGAIVVGTNQRQFNEGGYPGGSEDITISNNYITNIGKNFISAPAIKVARTINLSITHNTIIHVPYSAIMAGFGWNVRTEADFPNLQNAEIAYNYIQDCVYSNNDGGAIYVCGANAMPAYTEIMNTIHDNVVKSNAYNKTYTAVYMDGSSSNYRVYNNVLIDVKSNKGPMFFQDDVSSQYSHNILAENNYTTTSPISTSAKADRNIVLKNNTLCEDITKLPDAAKAILAAAGLEEAYKNIVSPMEIEVVLADPTIHYVIKEENNCRVSVNIQITNNSNVEKTFTVTLNGATPSIVETSFANNTITLAAGASGTVTATFAVTNPDYIYDSNANMMDIIVEDSTGKAEKYLRAFTVATKDVEGVKYIEYGTPVIDGKMDDAYQSSVVINFGDVFHPSVLDYSDLEGRCYLLWDEQYLYLYAVVEESTVMTLGADVSKEGDPQALWKGDVIETYIVTNWRGSARDTKFAVDAFGLTRFGNAGVDVAKHQALPYATAFTCNGQIIEGFKITNPTAGQMASTAQQPVTGYVIEMTLPLTEISTITDGVPKAGDVISFYVQNNDLQEIKSDGTPYVVCSKNTKQDYTLAEKTHKHTTTKVDGKDATCTENGVAEHYLCSCGKTFKDAAATQELETTVITAKGHTDAAVAGKDATCTEAGLTEGKKCSVCGTVTVEQKTIEALGHKLTKVEGKAATETAAGIKEHYACSGCDRLFLDAEGKTETTDVVIPMLDPIPPTGDSSAVTFFVVLAAVSAVCAAVLVTGKKLKF